MRLWSAKAPCDFNLRDCRWPCLAFPHLSCIHPLSQSADATDAIDAVTDATNDIYASDAVATDAATATVTDAIDATDVATDATDATYAIDATMNDAVATAAPQLMLVATFRRSWTGTWLKTSPGFSTPTTM